METESKLDRLLLARRILSQRLESLQRAGVEQIGRVPAPVIAAVPPASSSPIPPSPALATPIVPRDVRPRELPSSVAVAAPSPAVRPSSPPAQSPMPRKPAPAAIAVSPHSVVGQPYAANLPDAPAERQTLLDLLACEVRGCMLCSELARTRKQTVFGVGNPRPRVVFFGEAPGADEDRQGEPFVGRAGQLQTKIIEACGWKRPDVYIMNVLKCRPPDNRNPLPPEVSNCRPFFERQFEILRPEYIVCVGTVPAQALLETGDSVGKLRGRFYRYRDSKVLVTYHPAYLLRNPDAKKHVWDDMQMLLKEMGLPIPGRSEG